MAGDDRRGGSIRRDLRKVAAATLTCREFSDRADAAEKSRAAQRVVDAIAGNDLESGVSVKPTALGPISTRAAGAT